MKKDLQLVPYCLLILDLGIVTPSIVEIPILLDCLQSNVFQRLLLKLLKHNVVDLHRSSFGLEICA